MDAIPQAAYRRSSRRVRVCLQSNYRSSHPYARLCITPSPPIPQRPFSNIKDAFHHLPWHLLDPLNRYSPTFVGLVETPEDGVGVWTFGGGDATCIANANAQTFQGFARVCEGDFGAAVLQSGHTIVAVNCAFGPAKDIGQLWDRKLKRRAKALVEDCAWTPLFVCRPIRSPSGALGLLHYVWPGSYEVFCLKSGEPSELEDTEAPVLVRAGSAGPPSSREIFEALDARWEQIPAAERPRGLTMGGLWKGLW